MVRLAGVGGLVDRVSLGRQSAFRVDLVLATRDVCAKPYYEEQDGMVAGVELRHGLVLSRELSVTGTPVACELMVLWSLGKVVVVVVVSKHSVWRMQQSLRLVSWEVVGR